VINQKKLALKTCWLCLLNGFSLFWLDTVYGGPQLIISFLQYSLTFNITSLTFYYSSIKKITTKQNFSFFYTKHYYFFIFLKKKHSYFISHKCETKTKPKPFTKQTRCVTLFYLDSHKPKILVLSLKFT
jgi:hypothetical protein